MPLDPIKALYWSAVIIGLIAAPFMAVAMILARRKEVMGACVVRICIGLGVRLPGRSAALVPSRQR